MYEYKGKNYKVFTGPKGGQYIIINDKKKYIPKTNSQKEDSRMSNVGRNKTNSQNGRSNNNDTFSAKVLSCYVTDPEHEGDIDYQLFQLRKIGDIEVVSIDREYTEDGEELTEACINFKCKDSDYSKFIEFCYGQ